MSERELIPVGYYRAVAVPHTEEETGVVSYARFGYAGKEGAQTKQVVATFEILDGPYQGTRLSWFGFFTKDSAKRTVESLRYMGLKGNALEEAASQPLDQEVSIKVGHNEWEGKTHARVDWVNAPGGAGHIKLAKPMPREEMRKFSAMMRDSLAKLPDHAGKKAAPTGASSGAATSVDGGKAGASSTSKPGADDDGFGGNWAPDPSSDDIPF